MWPSVTSGWQVTAATWWLPPGQGAMLKGLYSARGKKKASRRQRIALAVSCSCRGVDPGAIDRQLSDFLLEWGKGSGGRTTMGWHSARDHCSKSRVKAVQFYDDGINDCGRGSDTDQRSCDMRLRLGVD